MGRVEEILTKMNVEAANIAAELASKKVQEIAEMATDTFYKGYDPEQYGRSYGLYAASQPYIKKISAPGTAHKEELLLLQVVCLDITTKGLM